MGWRMTVLGHQLTSARSTETSASPSGTDIIRQGRHVRLVPQQTHAPQQCVVVQSHRHFDQFLELDLNQADCPQYVSKSCRTFCG